MARPNLSWTRSKGL